MSGSDIQYTTRDGEKFDGYFVEPEGSDKAPAILLITAIFGVDEEMRTLSDEWARDGFLVSTPDIFWRQHAGPTADFDVAIDRMNKFDPVKGEQDIDDLIKHLRAHPRSNGKVAVLGFCFGGGYAHLAARKLGANAAGAFHGTGIGAQLADAGSVNVPLSYHFGAEDPIVPVDEVNAIKAAFADKPNVEIKLYDGATHNFAMPQKPGYNPEVQKASRAAVLETFRSM